MRSPAPAWLALAIAVATTTAAAQQPAPPASEPLPGPANPAPIPSAPATRASDGNIRRPSGVPPVGTGIPTTGSSAAAPPPTPRELTPDELTDLKSRMVTGARRVILDPKEITDLRCSVLDAQGAANFPGRDGRMPRPEPRQISVTERSSLSAPETLNLAFGVVSPITFVDAKGRPWPIASVAYDPRLFAQDGAGCGTDAPLGASRVAASAGGDRPSSINLMPCRVDTWGNILIRLEGFAYPVALMVLSGVSDHVDIPITVRVAGASPLQPVATARAGSTGPRPSRSGPVPTVNGDAQLLHLFGAGTPPRDAQALRASGGAQAWIYRDRMYVRARGSLLNPPHEASAEAADGYRVFQLARPSARLLAEGPDGSDVTITVDF